MIHIHRGKKATGGPPVVNLFPIGSTAFPATWSPFTVPAGQTYQIFSHFGEAALELGTTINATYSFADFEQVCSSLISALHIPLASGAGPVVAGSAATGAASSVV
jgi:hypothetical protein